MPAMRSFSIHWQPTSTSTSHKHKVMDTSNVNYHRLTSHMHDMISLEDL